jgi:hypothetical protein
MCCFCLDNQIRSRMRPVVLNKQRVKLRNTVHKLLHMHSVSQFSLQQLTPFESRFDFPDRLNLPKLMQRPKIFAARIGDDYFRGVSLLLTLQQEHSVSQFSQQQLTPFESHFNFPDRLNLPKLMQRQKMFHHANWRRRFPRWLSSCHGAASGQCFLVFSAAIDSI